MLTDDDAQDCPIPRQTNTTTHSTPETCLRLRGVAVSRAVCAGGAPLASAAAHGDSASLLRAPLGPLFSRAACE
jgi:hypothetical protein